MRGGGADDLAKNPLYLVVKTEQRLGACVCARVSCLPVPVREDQCERVAGAEELLAAQARALRCSI